MTQLFVSLLTLPPRTPWSNFPDVLLHASESRVKQHPAYQSAKAGHGASAMMLVRECMNPAMNTKLAAMLVGQTPILVSAHAYEKEGVNAIPEAFAAALSQALGWPHESSITQVNVVSHTGASGIARMARQAKFSGLITTGASYVMVDDFVGMGGTLANLKGYIETKGGVVLAAVALTGKPHSAKLTVSYNDIDELKRKHGQELEDWWLGRYAHPFSALTLSEARYLTKIEDAHTIRDRIIGAEQA